MPVTGARFSQGNSLIGSGRVGSPNPTPTLRVILRRLFLTRPDPRGVEFLLTRSTGRVIDRRTAMFFVCDGQPCTHLPRGGRCGQRAEGHSRRGSLARSRKFPAGRAPTILTCLVWSNVCAGDTDNIYFYGRRFFCGVGAAEVMKSTLSSYI